MEQLIECVRACPVLWNTTLEQYRDAVVKDSAWNEIAGILGRDKENVKAEWRKLRDCHRQSVLRKKTRSGQSAGKKPWKFESQMEFLVSVMTHKRGDSNIPPLELRDPVDKCAETATENSQNPRINEEPGVSLTPNVENQRFQAGGIGGRRKRKTRGVDKILRFMEKRQQCKQSHQADDLDLFFASACKSTRNLPRRLQNKIKRSLVDSIACAEEEFEEWQNSTSTPRFSGSPSSVTPICELSRTRST